MEEYMVSWGISASVFSFVIMPLLIFIARVCDVSLSTLRIMFVLNGKTTVAPILGFFEALIWLLAIGQIIQNIDNPVSYIAYAAGFAAGTYVGMVFEEKLAVGRVLVRVITSSPIPELIEFMKENNYRFTNVGAEGRFGKVNLLFTVIKREMLPEFIGKVKSVNDKAFYTIEGVKRISEDDLNIVDDKPSFKARVFNRIRK